jgi:hypothetical protein
MENQQLASILLNLTDNNKTLLKSVLEPMLDEIAFSEPNKVLIRHGGVVGDFVGYEKALTLLKRLGIIKDFKNTRAGKPVDNGTVYVGDKYEIIYEEETLLAFASLLNGKPAHTTQQQPSKGIGVPAEKITLHQLKPQHYSDRKGILVLNPTTEIAISVKGKTMHKNGKPYAQCKLMTELFRNGKTIKSGIFFSKFHGVNDKYIDKKMEKKIRNAVSEINKKVAAVGGPKNLIYIQDKKVHVNHSYL